MTMLKDDLLAQSYCRQLGELMAAAKINKLMSMHISEWCVELQKGIQIGIKEKKGTTPELIKVDIKLDDIELFIKELQDALTVYSSKQNKNSIDTLSEVDNELKTRKGLQNVLGGISPSTMDRFFRYLNENKIPFHTEALHGRSDVYRAGEMKALYVEYQKTIRNKTK